MLAQSHGRGVDLGIRCEVWSVKDSDDVGCGT